MINLWYNLITFICGEKANVFTVVILLQITSYSSMYLEFDIKLTKVQSLNFSRMTSQGWYLYQASPMELRYSTSWYHHPNFQKLAAEAFLNYLLFLKILYNFCFFPHQYGIIPKLKLHKVHVYAKFQQKINLSNIYEIMKILFGSWETIQVANSKGLFHIYSIGWGGRFFVICKHISVA